MTGFFERLEARTANAGSRLCVGLDPRADDASEARRRAVALIEATAAYAAAFKANAAFYEAHGPDGIEALIEVVAAVPEEIPVILDAKRGDIASTSAAYAAACFDVIGAGAVTVSPYLGRDAVDPFLAHEGRGVWVLSRTSNESGADIQDLDVGGQSLAERVARIASGWAGPDRLGLVAGATAPEALALVRSAAPEHWILAPGVGAQGGDPTILGAGLRADGSGLLVPVSRSVADATDPGSAAADLRDALSHLEARPTRSLRSTLARSLYDAGCIRFGEFTLRSGVVSPIYVDLRILVGRPRLLRQVASAYEGLVTGVGADILGAVPYGALPIATATSLATSMPLVWPRAAAKGHGTGARVEGRWSPGERVVLIDDVVTSGTSAVEAATNLRDVGLVVEDLVVLVDRGGERAAATLANDGIRLHAVATLGGLVDELAAADVIDATQHRSVMSFLDGA
jgi:uridine monophosphate synthetase